MDSTDPSPPPADDSPIRSQAVLVEIAKDASDEPGRGEKIRRLLDAFFHQQPDPFGVFGHGDVYFRLSDAEPNPYGATVSALRTISQIPGLARVSVVHHNDRGLGVTTVRSDQVVTHRSIHTVSPGDDR